MESNIYQRLGTHPRLLPIIVWDPEDCVLTIEFMPNGNLKDFIRAQNAQLSTNQRLQWAQEAAEGLQLLHDADVIHCDVEPRNFLIDANLGLKIGDFGGASFKGSQASAQQQDFYLLTLIGVANQRLRMICLASALPSTLL